MRTRAQLFSFLIFLTAICSTSANALEITLLGGLNYAAPTETKSSVTYHWTGNAALDYGFSISHAPFDPHFELESGLFVIAAETEGLVNGLNTQQKTKFLQLPVLIRFHFDPWVSVAVGGYYANHLGTVVTSNAQGTVSQAYDTAGFASSDAGLLVSLKAKLHLTEGLSLVVDARYEHGLVNLARPTSDLINTRSIQALGGFGYEF